jgi:UDPglucose 6-dehydrogenase
MGSDRQTIAVIGTGYVGLVTAVGFAQLGSEVWCVDVDAEKIEGLQRGEIPIYEPGLDVAVQRHRERLHFTTDLAPALEGARLLFVAVGTPPTYSGDADLSAVHAVVGAMPASHDHALVMKSTVPVGTGAAIKRIFAEQGKSGFAYVSCPEFLKEGSALEDFMAPDRVVVGDEGDWAGDAVVELYAPLQAPLVRTDVASAEMVKLAANAFLATKISFINVMAEMCETVGADVIQLADAIGLDKRIGRQFLSPGLGFGGGCLPKDIRAFSHTAAEKGVTSLVSLLSTVDTINLGRRDRVTALAREAVGGSLAGKRVATLGIAFKPNSDDIRDSPSLDICGRLADQGAVVFVHDPAAMANAARKRPDLTYARSVSDATTGADLVLHLTEWSDYRAIDPAALGELVASKVIVDARCVLDAAQWRAAGWTVHVLGRP